MVPTDQPQRSFLLINSFIRDVPLKDKPDNDEEDDDEELLSMKQD